MAGDMARDMRRAFFTIGHSTRRLEEVTGLVRADLRLAELGRVPDRDAALFREGHKFLDADGDSSHDRLHT